MNKSLKELEKMSIKDLEVLEDELWFYREKVKIVIARKNFEKKELLGD